MQTVNASEFKAKCLQWLDAVNETGEKSKNRQVIVIWRFFF